MLHVFPLIKCTISFSSPQIRICNLLYTCYCCPVPLSHSQLFATPINRTPGFPAFTISQSWFKFLSIELIMDFQSSHPLPSSSPPALSLSQHQGLFQGVSSSHQVAKVLEPQLQHQSFQWIFCTDFLQNWLVWSPCCKRDSQESSPAPQFQSINSSGLSFLCGPTLTSVHDCWKNHSFD